MKLTFSTALASLALTLSAMAQTTQPAEDAMSAFFKDYLEASFKLSPMRASDLGDHRFDHLLDDISASARKRASDLARETLKQLPAKVDYSKLPRPAQIDYEILRDSLKLDLWLEETERPFENDPRVYTNLATGCVYGLLTQSTLPKETNIQNAIARTRLVPQLLSAARENLHTPPQVVTTTAIQQNKGAIAFYREDVFEMIGDSPQRAELKKAADIAATALEKHQKFLEDEVLPRSTDKWRAGKEHFDKKLELVLDAGITADQALANAEKAFAEVRRDMLLVARQLWAKYFPKQPLPPDDEAGHRDTIQRIITEIGRDHGETAQLRNEAAATVAQIQKFITERDILALPKPDTCRIIEMPEFQRGNSVAFLNPAPALDAGASSIYAISPPPKDWDAARVASFLGEYNHQMLKVLTIHEAYPGHYVQLDYSNHYASLLRRVMGSGVYMEGWAVYCEQMMLDQGFGDGDLALRMMQLKFLLRCVANSILDNKMHCTAMTDEDALHLLVDEAFQGEGEAKLKIIRAKQSSCQLSTYFVGRTAFMNLRREIQRELADKFHLGRYHEAIMKAGPVPMKYMPEIVRAALAGSSQKQ